MSKLKYILGFAVGILFFTGIAYAQSIPQSSPLWVSGSYITPTPLNVSLGLKIPSLASQNCLGTDGTGAFEAGTCSGGGSSTFGTSSLSAIWPIIYTQSSSLAQLSFGGLSTSTPAVVGNIPYFSGVNTFANVATTTASCSGSASCTSFTIIGSSPITITATGGSGSPGGASSTVQYNANGAFAGNSGFTYTGTNVGIASATPQSSLTIGVDGTVSIPAVAVGTTGNQGIYKAGTNSLGFEAAGAGFQWNGTAITPNGVGKTIGSFTNPWRKLYFGDASGGWNITTSTLTTGAALLTSGGYPNLFIGADDASPFANVELNDLDQGPYGSFGIKVNNGGGTYTGVLVLDTNDTIAGIPQYLALDNQTGSATCLQIKDTGATCLSDYNGLSSLLDTISPAYNSSGTESGMTTTLLQQNGQDAIDFGLQNYPGASATGIDAYQNYYTSTYANPLPEPHFSFWEQANGNTSEAATSWGFLGATTTISGTFSTTTSINVGDLGNTAQFHTLLNPSNATFNVISSTTHSTAFTVSAITGGVLTTDFQVSNAGVASTTGLRISGISACNSSTQALQTDSSGSVSCGTISGGSSSFPFTPTTNFGATANATSTPIWFKAGLQASSTANLVATNIYGNLGLISTSTDLLETLNGVSFLQASSSVGNTFLGLSSGAAITNGYQNTGFGYQALLNATTTNGNTAIGYQALLGNSTNFTGTGNTALGVQALQSDTTGTGNTAIGNGALIDNTTGMNNFAIGSSLRSNTTGSSNVAIGYNAIVNGDGNNQDVGIGYQALSGVSNSGSDVGIGANAAASIGNGDSSVTAIGGGSMQFNITGDNTVAIGASAASGNFSNYSSQGGVYIGASSAYMAQSGSNDNTFVGFQNGYGLTTGTDNLLLGASPDAASYNQLTSGSQNVSLGYDVAIPSATANGQLDIQNIIYGVGNTGTQSSISTGNIGIGTTSPWREFSVGTGNTGTFGISTSTAGCAQFSALGELFSTGTACGGFAYPFKNTTFGSTIAAATTSALYPSGGLVSGTSTIGALTATSSLSLPFLSNGALNVSGGVVQSGTLSISNGGTGASSFSSGAVISYNGSVFTGSNSGNTPLVFANGGKLGVGTSTPFAELSVFAGNDYASHAPSTLFAVGSSTAGTATTTIFIVNSSGNVGIGTTTPTAAFVSVAASSTVATTAYTGLVSIVAGLENTTVKLFQEIDQWGHLITSGDTPTVTGGTSSVAGNDRNGTITITGTALTSLTLTFAHPYIAAPDCTESDNVLSVATDITSISATQVVFGFGVGGVSSGSLWYICQAHM